MVELLRFSAGWCAPCQAMRPAYEELKSTYPIKFTDFDIDDSSHMATKMFEVRGIPTFILIDDNGIEVERVVGLQPKSVLESLIERHLQPDLFQEQSPGG